MSAGQMLWSSLIGCAISLTVLYLTTEIWLVFTAVGLFGAAMSNCFATGFLFAQNFLEVTGKLATVFIFGAAVGWALLPSLAGFVLESMCLKKLLNYSPLSLLTRANKNMRIFMVQKETLWLNF